VRDGVDVQSKDNRRPSALTDASKEQKSGEKAVKSGHAESESREQRVNQHGSRLRTAGGELSGSQVDAICILPLGPKVAGVGWQAAATPANHSAPTGSSVAQSPI